MADTPAVAEPPAAPTTTPAPAPEPAAIPAGSPVPESAKGSQAFVTEMDALINPPKPSAPAQPETPAKPGEEPAETAKPKAAAKPIKDPVELRKRLNEIESKYAALEQTAANERKELQEKIAEYEKRKYLTADQEKQQQDLEKRAKQLEAELYSRDYRESPEFKQKYEAKWQRAYDRAVAEIKRLTVSGQDDTTRQARPEDFATLLKAPLEDQPRLARELFGEEAGLILAHRNTLKGIESEAGDELEQHRQTYSERQKQQQEMQRRFGEEYGRTASEIHAALENKYPEYFGKSEDQESNAAFAKGREFIDKTLEIAQELPVTERAARSAIINRWAASFPRMVYLTNKLRSELDEAKKQIAELRGTDPGAGGGGPSPTPTTKPMGTEALIAEFDKIG